MEKEQDTKMYKLVLTGGPCGGKTTGQSRLCTFFESIGWKVFRVPETASVLLSGGIKFGDLSAEQGHERGGPCKASQNSAGFNCDCKHCLSVSCHESEAFKFQENLLKTMIQIENTFFELGRSCNRNCLIICDRGAMDASAFISKDKWEKIMKDNNWNNVELRDNRYNQIIHMVSAANGAEEFYSTEDHSCRSEGVELAKELDRFAAEAWVGHPYFDVIDNSTDFEGKIRRMIGTVCQKVGIETGDRLLKGSRKLKFLVSSPLVNDSEFPPFQDFEVVHTYLQSDSPIQVRLRKRGQKGNYTYTHTVRRQLPNNGQMIEVKTPITHRDYINLLQQKDRSHFTIYKKRRCFLINNQYFQLDIYQGPSHPRCRGLILLETYTTLDKDSLLTRLPKFLKVEKEVTGNPDFSMFNLSLREDWNTTKKFCKTAIMSTDDGSTCSDPKNCGHSKGLEAMKSNGHAEDMYDKGHMSEPHMNGKTLMNGKALVGKG